MKRRRITHVRRDDDGEIEALCNPEKQWSPIHKETMVRHLSIGLFEYYVSEDDHITYVKLDELDEDQEIFTTPDPDSPNNLRNLPEPEAVAAA